MTVWNVDKNPEAKTMVITAEFKAHKYDVKWLLREIALSKTYQRSSEVLPSTPVPADANASPRFTKPTS